jgi:hypothetical protein
VTLRGLRSICLLAAQGGLRLVEPRRSAAEMAGLGERHEVAERFDVDHDAKKVLLNT